jgi:hypothetical protein
MQRSTPRIFLATAVGGATLFENNKWPIRLLKSKAFFGLSGEPRQLWLLGNTSPGGKADKVSGKTKNVGRIPNPPNN